MDCEILLSPEYASRGALIIRAMHEAAAAAGITAKFTSHWRGLSRNFMMYGMGDTQRMAWTRRHLKQGGQVIGWDLGYWNRQGDDPSMRLTVGRFHPWPSIVPEDPARWDSLGVELREDADPNGPILLCGMGIKQRRVMGAANRTWEMVKLEELRLRFPKKRIVYRPKRSEKPLPGCALSVGCSIEEAMRGCSLLVCQHSNTAVDACIAGVPVLCSDGAAYALYKSGASPTREQRLDFLRSLAHWNYKISEAPQAWQHLKKHLYA